MNELLELSIDDETFRIANRESEHREFKKIFDNESLWKYAKTMAAFANRDGGIIFFGIKDSPKELIGIVGDKPNELIFANFLKEYFEPEIPFEFDTKIYLGKTIAYVLVPSSSNKPIVCKKKKVQQSKEKGKPDKELLREGAIYYRYSSASDEIKFPELRKILDERVQKVFHSLVDNITLINKVGHDRAVIVDAAGLSGDNNTATVYITTETAKNMNWISKGRFSETEDEAEKAFYVVKEVEIKHGIEVEKSVPTDPSDTHPFTKTELSKSVQINSPYLDPILIKLNILNNPEYDFPQKRGKITWHNFSERAVAKILVAYPIDMTDRKVTIKKIYQDYTAAKNKVTKS